MEISALKKTYKMRRNSAGRNSIVVAMPFEVVEREARKRDLNVDDFLGQYQVVAAFDSFDGVHYTFEKVTEVKNGIHARGEGNDPEISDRGGEPSK